MTSANMDHLMQTCCDDSGLIAQSRFEDVLVLMYSAIPEPPTLNAILILRRYFRNVVLLRNNLYFPTDSYPDAPILIEIGRALDTRSAISKRAPWKLSRFARYC